MNEIGHSLLSALIGASNFLVRLGTNIWQSHVTHRLLRIWSGMGNALLVSGICLVAVTASFTAPLSKQYPIQDTLRPAVKRPLILIDAEGRAFAERGDCVAAPVTLDELPKHLIDGVVSMEDRRFYSHIGIDPKGILRAALRNYRADAIRQGGSTITQQLVKMSFLTDARTYRRKFDEALLAMWLEFRLTKAQILERYLSSAYFGEGCFGVRAAAKHFFDKPVGELSLSDSALLVALLRSPTQLTQNFDDARKRAKLVLEAMVRDGRLDKTQLADIKPARLNRPREEEFGGYYADWLTDSVEDGLKDPHAREPVKVYTTFQPGLQHIAQEAVRKVLDKQGRRYHAGQAALVAMRTDGRVVAMVGGKDRAGSQFNRAVQAHRQPGSAFKPFVYLAALRSGARPDMVVPDEPITVDGWEPKNYGGDYRGPVTLTQAFAYSINTVAVRLSEAVGRDTVIAAARDLGIESPLHPNPSLPLGTADLSLLEMTSAYASIAAGAYPVKPWGVAGLDAKPADGGEPPRDAGLWKLAKADELRGLLSAVVESGTGHAARLPIETYGKTGTSQDYRDAWFIGFAGNLVVGVWVGNDDNSPMKRVTGGSLPAEIWARFMRGAMKSDPHFARRLPIVASFQARDREPLAHPMALAALEGLTVAVSSKPRERDRYSQTWTRGYFERDPEFYQPYERPGWRERGGDSRDFDDRLNDLGWPGQ